MSFPSPNHFVVVGFPPGGSVRRRGRRRGAAAWSAGFTLLETVVAAALLTLFLTSLFAVNSTAMRMLRSASETAAASQELQARVEQLRLTPWPQVTRSAWVRDVLLTRMKTDAVISDDLPGMSERVEGRRDGAAVASFAVTRNPDGTVVADPDADLSGEKVVYFHVTVRWNSWGGRARSRELVTAVSRAGIGK